MVARLRRVVGIPHLLELLVRGSADSQLRIYG
jgi:hypothetical protein